MKNLNCFTLTTNLIKLSWIFNFKLGNALKVIVFAIYGAIVREIVALLFVSYFVLRDSHYLLLSKKEKKNSADSNSIKKNTLRHKSLKSTIFSKKPKRLYSIVRNRSLFKNSTNEKPGKIPSQQNKVCNFLCYVTYLINKCTKSKTSWKVFILNITALN